MQIFVTGTDTDVGKTVISAWLCLHTKYSYFKPIQTGIEEGTDTDFVHSLTGIKPFKEAYRFNAPLSPHLAASRDGEVIDSSLIALPACSNLIIEGAGGLYVPLNDHTYMIDLINQMQAPVILVAKTKLGTINHTLLSLSALRQRSLKILGVILNGPLNPEIAHSIEYYGETSVLAQVPEFNKVSATTLLNFPLNAQLRNLFAEKEG